MAAKTDMSGIGTGYGRPRVAAMPFQMRVAYDWLLLNGVDEWLPERPTIVVDTQRGQLTFDAWAWEDGAGRWNFDSIAVTRPSNAPRLAQRTVPLKVGLNRAVRDALAASGAHLIETE